MANEAPITPKVDPAQAIQALNSISGTFDNMLGLVTKIGVGFAAWKIGNSVYEKMKTTESQLIALTTTFQDAGKGVMEYQKALKYASKTPFNVEQVIDAVKTLSVAKLDPWSMVDVKNGRNLINVLGDMGTAMGHDLQHATLALNRALVGEWEIMQNNYKISGKMIPQLKGLTSGTKEYADAVIKYLTQQNRFIGGMKLQAASLSGMVSNLGDVIDVFQVGLTGVADSNSFLGKATLYDSVRESVRKLYEVASKAPMEEMQGFIGTLNTLQNTKSKDLTNLVGFDPKGNFLKNMEAFYQVTGMTEKELRGLTGSAVNTNEKLQAVLKNNAASILKVSEGLAQTRLMESIGMKGQDYGMAKNIKLNEDAVAALSTELKKSKEEIRDMGLQALFASKNLWENHRAMDALIASGIKIENVMSQGDKIMALGQIFGQVARIIWDSFIDPLFSGISFVGGAIFDLSQKILGMIAPLEKLAGSTANTIAYVGDLLVKYDTTIDEHNQVMNEKFTEEAVKHRSALQRQMMIFAIFAEFSKIIMMGYLEDITDKFRGSLGALFSSVVDGFSALAEGFTGSFDLSKAIDFVDGQLKGFLNSTSDIVDSVSSVIDNMQVSFFRFGNSMGEVFNDVISGVDAFLTPLREVVTEIVTVFIEAFGSYLPGALEDTGSALEVVGTLFKWLGYAIGFALKIVSPALKGIAWLLGQLAGIIVRFTAFTGVFGKLGSVIGGVFGGIGGAASKAMTYVSDLLKGAKGSVNLSNYVGKTLATGMNAVSRDMAAGVLRTQRYFTSVAGSMAEKATGLFNKVTKSIPALSNIGDGIGNLKDKIKNSGMVQGMNNLVNNSKEKLSGFFSATLPELLSKLGEKTTSLTKGGFFTNFLNKIPGLQGITENWMKSMKAGLASMWSWLEGNRIFRMLFGLQRIPSIKELLGEFGFSLSGDFSWADKFNEAVNWFRGLVSDFKSKINELLNWKIPSYGFERDKSSLLGFTFKRLAVGTDFVPKDDMPALLHKGEMVVPAAQANYLRILKTLRGFHEKPEPAKASAPINIEQNFYGRQNAGTSDIMKSSVRELAVSLGV